MRKLLSVIALLACTSVAFAQMSKIPQRNEIVQIDINDGLRELEIFNSPKDGENHYYLSLGRLMYGDQIVQVRIDPISELFIPLGNTLEESANTLAKFQDIFKSDPGTSVEIEGCVRVGIPKEDDFEPVTVTYRKVLVSKQLEFSVKRGDYVSSADVGKSDLASLVNTFKLYRKTHRKQP